MQLEQQMIVYSKSLFNLSHAITFWTLSSILLLTSCLWKSPSQNEGENESSFNVRLYILAGPLFRNRNSQNSQCSPLGFPTLSLLYDPSFWKFCHIFIQLWNSFNCLDWNILSAYLWDISFWMFYIIILLGGLRFWGFFNNTSFPQNPSLNFSKNYLSVIYKEEVEKLLILPSFLGFVGKWSIQMFHSRRDVPLVPGVCLLLLLLKFIPINFNY